MGLLCDLLLVAPNTKLASQKVTRALYSLYEERALDMAVRSGTVLTPADCIDKIDTGIRTLLCFIRELKQDTTLYTKLARSMSAGDIMKLDACLEKVQGWWLAAVGFWRRMWMTLQPHHLAHQATLSQLQS